MVTEKEFYRNLRSSRHMGEKLWDPISQDEWQSKFNPKNLKLLNRMNSILQNLQNFVPDYNVDDTAYNDDILEEKLALVEILERRVVELRKECDGVFYKRYRRVRGYSWGT